jgi:acyl-CoA thioesterase-1
MLGMIGLSTPTWSATKPTLVVLGDSLSAAYGIAAEQGWVSLLQQRLREQGFPHRVVNASISGDTTRSAQQRVIGVLVRHTPTIVIIELGGNDGLRGLSLVDMKANLTAIVRRAQQRGAKVLLVGMKIPPNYGPRYVDQFNALYTELARELKAGLVPFLLEGLDQDQMGYQNDGIHPTAASQPRMLENVWPHLKALLEEK